MRDLAQPDAASKPRRPLTRERVLRAAVSLADARGIEELTMRKLGQELGVEAMSLYNHVSNKEDVLDGLVEVVAGEILAAVAQLEPPAEPGRLLRLAARPHARGGGLARPRPRGAS